MLNDQRILLGVTGSISAYKACDLVQRLKEKGAEVRVVMTQSAAQLVHPNTFAALTGHSVSLNAWEDAALGHMRHIEDARWATAYLIAPCTAHSLAEISLGLTGSTVSMSALAFKGPLIVAPAMNTVMYDSAPIREHRNQLVQRGVHLLPTASGELACGEVGEGKLLSPEEIVAYTELVLSSPRHLPRLQGLRVLISAGHTEEPVDEVRFFSNRSSGKTALAIARAFHLRGAQVQLVLGKVEEPVPAGMEVIRVQTSAEFLQAMDKNQAQAQVIVMAAAIADFVPSHPKSGKIKDSKALKNIELHSSVNILSELGKKKTPGQILVGFALEKENALAYGREKMKSRNCDVMVVNNPLSAPGQGFGMDAVEVAILQRASHPTKNQDLVLMDKSHLASELVATISSFILPQ